MLIQLIAAAVVALLGLGTLPVGMRAIHRWKLKRLALSIAALEIAVGIVAAPTVERINSPERAAQKWAELSTQKAANYSQGVSSKGLIDALANLQRRAVGTPPGIRESIVKTMQNGPKGSVKL